MLLCVLFFLVPLTQSSTFAGPLTTLAHFPLLKGYVIP